ncbi:MAG: response regulator transcription factor [Bacteroidales bacterium]|nr:response regulator transcription factor [Bacteroidales bacterium]
MKKKIALSKQNNKVVIIDQYEIFRLGLKSVLSKQSMHATIVGEAAGYQNIDTLLSATHPDILLISLDKINLADKEIVTYLKQTYPDLKLIVLTDCQDEKTIVNFAKNNRIEGLLSKTATPQDVAFAIQSIRYGNNFYSQTIKDILYNGYILDASSRENEKIQLTNREVEIVLLCSKGLLAKEIAARMQISKRTVETHKRNIFKKLGVSNMREMILYAVKNGIIERI